MTNRSYHRLLTACAFAALVGLSGCESDNAKVADGRTDVRTLSDRPVEHINSPDITTRMEIYNANISDTTTDGREDVIGE